MVFSSIAQTRNRNIVLIEEFTNTGCGPCASYSPTLDTVISYRLGEVIAIKYHGSYPDRNDPFYLDQQTDIDKRIALYDISAYPTTIMNGDEIGNSMSGVVLGNYITSYLEEERNYDINVNSSVSDHNLSVSATVVPVTDVADASNIRLFIVPIEEFYESSTAYSNGETEMRYIMRRMLPNADGYAIGSALVAGTEYNYETSCSLSNFENENQLGIVAFLQDMSTKKILATTYIPRKASGNDKIELMNFEDTPDYICTPNYYGLATFRNSGANIITSAKLNIDVNGTVKTYDWTGNLDYLDKATINIDNFTGFTLNSNGNNNVSVYFSDINGTDNKSNEFNLSFSNAIQAKGAVQLRIYTDRKPEETTWKLLNSAGDVVEEGGPYENARTFYEHNFSLSSDDCYMIEFYDAGGDGIVGNYGNGYYQLYQLNSDGGKTRLGQGYYDGSYYNLNFNLDEADSTLGIDEIVSELNADTKVCIYDISGNLLLKTTSEGLKTTDVSKLGHGVMIISINDGNKECVRKIVNK
ncbi:MAG: Omp28-related outer membrane protein [Prevotellaceae bacterium]|nr:Omp28-related outer membrane protein [Prevotellaceae bacterium]